METHYRGLTATQAASQFVLTAGPLSNMTRKQRVHGVSQGRIREEWLTAQVFFRLVSILVDAPKLVNTGVGQSQDSACFADPRLLS